LNMRQCANTPDSSTFNPAEPVGLFACAGQITALGPVAGMCGECFCALIHAGENDCNGNYIPDTCEDGYNDCNQNGVWISG
jgi:hypothetical protein